MQKQYRDLKSKHPDAMLLFRCGDFYETYEDDAKECAKVLGITLTKRQSDGVAMAGFPHHALDTYLPKLIRTGHRVAICDQLDPPPGPRPKRGENIDKAAIKREQSDACIDSAEREQAQTKFNNSNNQNNSEAMKQEMKVADLIGKSISNGGNAKYTINAIEGDKVSVTFQMGDSEGKPMTMGVAQVEKLLQGGWQVSDGTQEPAEKKADGGSQKAEEPKAKTVKMTSEREQSGTRSGSAERESSRPQGKMEPEPKPKAEKPKVTLKRKQPQTEEPETKAGKLTYSTYTNAKGKTCAKVSGFAETDAAYQKEAAASLHGSATYENTKQGRVNFLLFGPRYAEVAKTVCQMLNEGKTVADCQAVVDAATEERAQKREEWKQKREAYRQEHDEHGSANLKPETKVNGKAYSSADVAAILQKVMAGGKLPKDIEEAMMKAA
jgi:hypothetical protein